MCYEFANAPSGSTGAIFQSIVIFVEGKLAWITYTKKDDSAFTNQEIKTLLRLNDNGYVWTKTATTVKEVDYSAHLDGRVALIAWCAKGKGEFNIITSDYLHNREGK